jgi:hypothetical protein
MAIHEGNTGNSGGIFYQHQAGFLLVKKQKVPVFVANQTSLALPLMFAYLTDAHKFLPIFRRSLFVSL